MRKIKCEEELNLIEQMKETIKLILKFDEFNKFA